MGLHRLHACMFVRLGVWCVVGLEACRRSGWLGFGLVFTGLPDVSQVGNSWADDYFVFFVGGTRFWGLEALGGFL